jgi:hypothetical protein
MDQSRSRRSAPFQEAACVSAGIVVFSTKEMVPEGMGLPDGIDIILALI